MVRGTLGMKRTNDRLNAAHELLREYTALLACGVPVPDRLVRQAHDDLLRALQQTRREAIQRRSKRKVKGDAA